MHPEVIKAKMRMSGVSPAMLADRIGVSASSVSQTIAGKIKSPRIQKAVADLIGETINAIWPNQIRLRRSRQEIEAQRAR
jgi:lambda repressor-like predicted transcriptional regulator